MRAWSYSKAVAAIEQLAPTGTNLRLACYWLSLWDGEAPPKRSALNPARITELLPGLALNEMHADGAPVCRLSGTAIDRALGRSVSGRNLLDFLPQEAKAIRRSRVAALVAGGVAISRTSFTTNRSTSGILESLQLPFHGRSETGSRQYLGHINWRPAMGFATESKPGLGLGLPESYAALPIC